MRLIAVSIAWLVVATVATAQPKAVTPPPAAGTKTTAEDRNAAAGAGVGIAALLGFACVGLVGLVFTFVPVMIAAARGHPNTVPIALVCFFLGWTGIGWIGALIWSFMSPAQGTTVVNVRGNGGNDNRRRRNRDEDHDD